MTCKMLSFVAIVISLYLYTTVITDDMLKFLSATLLGSLSSFLFVFGCEN